MNLKIASQNQPQLRIKFVVKAVSITLFLVLIIILTLNRQIISRRFFNTYTDLRSCQSCTCIGDFVVYESYPAQYGCLGIRHCTKISPNQCIYTLSPLPKSLQTQLSELNAKIQELEINLDTITPYSPEYYQIRSELFRYLNRKKDIELEIQHAIQ